MMVSLHAMVREAALKHGSKTAVRLDSGSSTSRLTFQELLDSADELSTKLQRAVGQNEHMIGLYCHVNILLPAWICGVLQMPAAYVPFDPISPPQLIMRVMDRCDLKFCLIQSSLLQHFRSVFSSLLCVQVCAEWPALNLTLVKTDRRALAPSEASKTEGPRAEDNPVLQAEEDPNSHLNAGVSGASQQTEQLAYVLHTSGTTGLPKIVKVPHKCIVPNIIHFRSLFQITPEDIIFLGSPLTFDPSVVEMFLALSSGACLLMVPNAVKRMPGKLAHVLFRRNSTTVLQVTPTLIRRFGGRVLQEQVLSAGSSLRVLALGGEVCPSPSLLRSWRQEGNKTRIYNLYGTTEVSCWACCFEVPDSLLSSGCFNTGAFSERASSSVPLGEPLLDTVVEVRDERGCVVTEGEGQVFIGGQERVCLLDNEITPIRGIMRATGDWVIVQNSHLYYLGRKDRLIKRHGQPVQLDSLQQAIESLPQVEAAVVGLHEGGRLVAFVVPVITRSTNNSSVVSINQDLDVQNVTDGSPIDSSFSRSLEMEVLQGLSQLVPSHSIPDTVILVPALPLTNHGKVAMQKLMRLYERQREVSSTHTALGDTETVRERLQTLWKECLGLSDDGEVTEDAQFMLSGGDSLQALRLYDYLILTTGTDSEGLLEVILDGTFSDVLNHITTVTQHSTAETPAKRQHVDSTSVSRKKNSTEVTSKVKPEHLVVHSEKTMGFVVVRRAGEVVEWPYSQSTKQLIESKTDLTQDVSKESYPEVGFRTSPHENNSSGIPTELYPANITPIKIDTTSGNVQGQDCGSGATLPSHNQPLSLQVSWSSDTGRCVDASPVLLVGPKQSTVFIGSHSNRFQALDLHTGDVVWERVLGDRLESSAALSKCGSLVAVGCYDGLVYFLWVNSGETRWMYKTGDAVKSSPTVDPQTGFVIVGSHDGYVYALNPLAKLCVWKHYCGGGAVFSSPCIHSSPRQLYCATLRGQLHCLNPDGGNLLWTYSSDVPFFSSPSCSDSCVCIGSVNGCISAFNHNGHMLWNFLTDGPVFSSPSLTSFPPPANQILPSSYDGGTTLTSASQVVVCGSHDCSVYCLNSTNGSLLWRFRTTGKVYSSPFVFNGTPWGVRTLVAVASADGTVWILDGEHGTLKASLTLRGELFSSPVVWGRTIVVGCRNDYVYCLELLQNKQIVKTGISEP